MQYDLVVADMDGTLLRNDKTISERSLRAIRQYEAAGGRFTIATGRCLEGVGPYLRQLGLQTPLLLLNGGLLHDPVTGTDLLVRAVDPAALAQVWPILTGRGLDLVVYGPRGAAAAAMNDVVAAHRRHDGIGIAIVPRMCPATLGPVVKVLTIGAPDVLDQVEQQIAAAAVPVRLVRSYAHYLEVLPPEGGKGAALTALLTHLGMGRNRSLAIGDGLNDLDLLEAAGLSVAMANGHPAVKAAAGRITAANMADGVADVLEALALGRPVGTAPDGLQQR